MAGNCPRFSWITSYSTDFNLGQFRAIPLVPRGTPCYSTEFAQTFVTVYTYTEMESIAMPRMKTAEVLSSVSKFMNYVPNSHTGPANLLLTLQVHIWNFKKYLKVLRGFFHTSQGKYKQLLWYLFFLPRHILTFCCDTVTKPEEVPVFVLLVFYTERSIDEYNTYVKG